MFVKYRDFFLFIYILLRFKYCRKERCFFKGGRLFVV